MNLITEINEASLNTQIGSNGRTNRNDRSSWHLRFICPLFNSDVHYRRWTYFRTLLAKIKDFSKTTADQIKVTTNSCSQRLGKVLVKISWRSDDSLRHSAQRRKGNYTAKCWMGVPIFGHFDLLVGLQESRFVCWSAPFHTMMSFFGTVFYAIKVRLNVTDQWLILDWILSQCPAEKQPLSFKGCSNMAPRRSGNRTKSNVSGIIWKVMRPPFIIRTFSCKCLLWAA